MTSITIPKVKVESFLRRNLKGRYFGITFRKQNGEIRTLNARLGIKPSGNGRKTVGKVTDPYLVVFSNNDQGYRAVNLNTVYNFTMDGKKYNVRQDGGLEPQYVVVPALFRRYQSVMRDRVEDANTEAVEHCRVVDTLDQPGMRLCVGQGQLPNNLTVAPSSITPITVQGFTIVLTSRIPADIF